jgi:hypothetical protein
MRFLAALFTPMTTGAKNPDAAVPPAMHKRTYTKRSERKRRTVIGCFSEDWAMLASLLFPPYRSVKRGPDFHGFRPLVLSLFTAY